MGVLSDKPLFVLISSYSTGLAPSVMSYLLGITAGKRAAGKIEAQELGLRSNRPVWCCVRLVGTVYRGRIITFFTEGRK